MVQIIENYANLKGVIEGEKLEENLSNNYLINFRLNESSSIDNYPNLSLPDLGKLIQIQINQDWKNKLPIGQSIILKVKKVKPNLYKAIEIL